MDCRNARLLLEFAHPARGELDAPELEALRQHLGQCPECGRLEETERRADDALGRALRAVPVPAGLRDRLLVRLRADRRRASRGWAVAASAAAAAVLLLAALGVWQYSRARVGVDLAAVQEDADRKWHSGEDAVTEWLRGVGGDDLHAPPDFEYGLLETYGTTQLQGRQVPFLLFARGEGEAAHFAMVYVLSGKTFDLPGLRADYSQGLPGTGLGPSYAVRPTGGSGEESVAYLVIYTGADLEPFLRSNTGPVN